MENQELIKSIKELTQTIEDLKLLMRLQMSREDMRELKSRGK